MWQAVESVLRQLDQWRCRRNVLRALALHRRGEVRADGLTLLRLRNRLEILWRSRETHPWDVDVAGKQRAELFYEQLIADTEAAIFRLFHALPQIEWIDLQVLEPTSDNVILTGSVHRSALDSVQALLSARMRLHRLGVELSALDSLR